MSHLNFRLFGYPQIEGDSGPLKLDRRKAIALLAYLSVRGKSQSREVLADLFWPEYTSASALANLRRTLHALSQALGDGWLQFDRFQISFNPTGDFQCDVLRFRSLLALAAAHSHPEQRLCTECLNNLKDATALYQDDFLAGFSLTDCPEFEYWHQIEGDILRQQLAQVLEQVALAQSSQGNYPAAITSWMHSLRINPLYEEAHKHLMELYSLTGQRDAALRQYQEYAFRLGQEMQARPSGAIAEMYARIRAGQRVSDLTNNNYLSVPRPPSSLSNQSTQPKPDRAREPLPLQAMGSLQRTKQTYFFHIIDTDGDGQIGWSDFERYLQQAVALCTLSSTALVVERAIEDLDNWWQGVRSLAAGAEGVVVEGAESGEHYVGLEEWLFFWDIVLAQIAAEAAEGRRISLSSLEESVHIHFRLFDRDQDGLLSAQEYSRWMVAWGSNDDAISNFRRLDQDRDGYLTHEDAVRYVREFHFSNDPEAAGNSFYGLSWNGKR